ncbi:MAG: sigma-70 family RNA polymerase sigma factor [Bacteroidetes bacterium]|nr:sigma-70 family RNA polymerase sigma factor [Bacteroidota bacterium]
MKQEKLQYHILEAQSGNQLAFNAILNEFWDQVYHFQLSRNIDPFDAEDICIQTFAKAFDKLATYNSEYKFTTWLLSISKNLHIDLIRSRKKSEWFSNHLEENEEVVDDAVTFEDNENYELQQKRLSESIKRLTETHQRVVTLRYFDELSIAEIAHRMEQSEGNIKVLLLRARRSLAENLKNYS